MKIKIFSLLAWGTLLFAALLFGGCPVSISYPLAEGKQIEKIDKRLLGKWVCKSDSAEVLSVNISQKDDTTFSIEVLEKGEMFSVETSDFWGWTTKLDGHSLIFSKPADQASEEFYLYHYAFEGSTLVIHDVSLMEGGVDAVTSTESYRKQVAASLKHPNCLQSRFEYARQ